MLDILGFRGGDGEVCGCRERKKERKRKPPSESLAKSSIFYIDRCVCVCVCVYGSVRHSLCF